MSMSEGSIPVIGFAGHGDSGKTTLASQVVRYFHTRGRKPRTLVEWVADRSEEESSAVREKYLTAGAIEVSFCTADEMQSGLMSAAGDVVVVDGFAASSIPKVFVFRTEEQAHYMGQVSEPIVAAVTVLSFQKENEAGLPVYYFNELDELVETLENLLFETK